MSPDGQDLTTPDDTSGRRRRIDPALITPFDAETAEPLAPDFALADGTRVTWGEATVEQHESVQEWKP